MRSALLSLILWTSPTIALYAQETTGRLRGRTVDADSVPIASTVEVQDTARQARWLFHSGADGYFTAAALDPGEYTVHVRAIGFREFLIPNVVIHLGETTSLGTVTLERAVQTLDSVVVGAAAQIVDPLSTSIGTSLSARVADALPVGRDYASLLLLFPQTNEGYRQANGIDVAGGTGYENAFYVDGINVTEGMRNSGGIQLPHSFVDHVGLKTGGYEPEFGRALGGVVSVTTRRGSNTPTLSAFSYYTASSLASTSARSALDFATGRFSRYDMGASASGPIRRNRLWYFAAYDHAVSVEDIRLPSGPEGDRARSDQYAGKLTWQPDARSELNATIIGDPSRHRMVGNAFWGGLGLKSLVNADPYLGFQDEGGAAIALTAHRLVSNSWLIETSLARATFFDRTGPRTPAGATQPLVIDFVSGEWSGGPGNQWDRHGTRLAASVTSTYATGPHLAKFGLQIEANAQRESWQWTGNGPQHVGVIFRSDTSSYVGLPLDLRTRVRTRIPTLFAQGSFLANPHLRLNGGVRWEGQYFSSPTTGRSSAISDELQPRVGAIIYPAAGGRHKISISAGRFYEQVPSQPITWFWGGLHQDVFIYAQNPLADSSYVDHVSWDDVPESGIKGEYYDAVTLGYEATLGRATAVSAQFEHRQLRQVLAELADPDAGNDVLANPGRGKFSDFLGPNSRYDALVLSVAHLDDASLTYMLSYVLSRKFGNYAGIRDLDNGNPNPHANGVTDFTGPLPNDRTHVLRGFVGWRARPSLLLGATASVMSGTPLSDFGKRSPDPGTEYIISGRGNAGRTPAVWDLSARAAYDLPWAVAREARVVVDVLHAFSQRRAVLMDQVRYLAVDASDNPTDPNPFYRSGLQFQPPMTLRIGVELERAGASRR